MNRQFFATTLQCLLMNLAVQFGAVAASSAELFDLSQVQLLDGPFLRSTQVNRDQILKHEPDRLLAPFLIEAGLPPKAPAYPNWEATGLGGHTAGHYLSTLANLAVTLEDDECRRRLTYMVAELARCQQAIGDGYVGGVPNGRAIWEQIKRGDIRSAGFSLNGGWVPFYNLHKTFAGLRDAYLVAGNRQARDVLVGLAEWCNQLLSHLSDQQVQLLLDCEHGGMNEVLADVAAITGDDKYLDLAKRFSHRVLLDPLAEGRDQLDGMHANTQVPKVIGFERIAALGGGPRYHDAARFFWETVVQNRTIAIGGNSVAEHFPSSRQSMEFISRREGPETCNTYNMLRLTEQLHENSPEARFADFYERALLNHILSSQHPEHGGYVYFTPARPRHYRVYSRAERCFWCCVGSGMENHSRHGTFIYSHGDASLYVNLFIASRVRWDAEGVTVTQKTSFPDEPRTSLELSLEKPTELTIHVRCPAWVEPNRFRITINGEETPTDAEPSSYAAITRTWRDGDRIDVELPMRTTVEPLPNLEQYVALLHGPLVLAAATGQQELKGLVADEGRMDHVAEGKLLPLDQAPMLVCDREQLANLVVPASGQPLAFTIADAVRPARFDDLVLQPFFRVHDARYMLYWRQASPAEYAAVVAESEAAERAHAALDEATVDQVSPGEQQPETEHNFRGEETSTGTWRDRRYRHAGGWFSYDLRAGGQRDLRLQVTYFGSDRRRFNILVNGQMLAEVDLDAPRPGEFFDVAYPIPDAVLNEADDGVLTVTFAAKPQSMAGGIYDLRLLKSPGGDQPSTSSAED